MHPTNVSLGDAAYVRACPFAVVDGVAVAVLLHAVEAARRPAFVGLGTARAVPVSIHAAVCNPAALRTLCVLWVVSYHDGIEQC